MTGAIHRIRSGICASRAYTAIGVIGRWVAWLLEVEPSWIMELGAAVGATSWGIFAITTDDLMVRGTALVLPILAIIGGVVRVMVLVHLWYAARALLSGLSGLLWAWLLCALITRYGTVSLMGPVLALFVGDLASAAKFSIPCARAMRAQRQAGRNEE